MFPYIGGKFFIRDKVIKAFPYNYKDLTYVEVFGGAGWVITYKDRSFNDVYNDVEAGVSNLYYVLTHPRSRREFLRRSRYVLDSRIFFNRYLEIYKNDTAVDDIERAMVWAYLQCNSFNCVKTVRMFSVHLKNRSRYNIFLRHIIALRNILNNINVESLDCIDLIKKYDSPTTFFYLDPPYLNKEKYYKNSAIFNMESHENLCAVLKDISGKFLLSYYKEDIITNFYRGFNMLEFNNRVKLRGCKKRDRVELFISNYDFNDKHDECLI